MNLTEVCQSNKYLLVFTGFDYTLDSSGTSKVVKAHEGIFIENGIDYIVINPIKKIIDSKKNKIIHTGCYGVIVNGMYVGVYTVGEIILSLAELNYKNKFIVGILVHHIINNCIDMIDFLLDKVPNAPIVFYLHDFYSYCVNPTMLKNDREFCAVGKIDCSDCIYCLAKEKHNKQINALFHKYNDRIMFLSPAEFTKKVWSTLYPQYADKVKVIPHLVSVGTYNGNIDNIPKGSNIKVAFVGAQADSKGWSVFKDIVKSVRDVNFFYFGNGKEEIDKVTNTNVQIHLQGKNAMINALRAKNIDVAILAAICPETYSYTMYESRAANCFILTLASSGNIAITVEKEKFGRVFPDKTELLQYFSDVENIRKDINYWKSSKNFGAYSYDDNTEIMTVFNFDNVYAVNSSDVKVNFIQKTIRFVVETVYDLKERKRRNNQCTPPPN